MHKAALGRSMNLGEDCLRMVLASHGFYKAVSLDAFGDILVVFFVCFAESSVVYVFSSV